MEEMLNGALLKGAERGLAPFIVGINVNVIPSPAFMARLSRISLGIVVCPLWVSVASFEIAISFLPYVFNYSKAVDFSDRPTYSNHSQDKRHENEAIAAA